MLKLKELMDRATCELEAREEARKSVEDKAQKARTRSKQAIQLVHGGNYDKADSKIAEAATFLGEMTSLLGSFPDFTHYSSVAAAWQEYAEAVILRALLTRGDYPDPGAVPLDHYLLGLGDVVGELRRAAVDDLRVGKVDSAESKLGLMEEVYDALISGEVTLLIKEMRRKIDAARGIIEATRGDIALEAGRKRLDDSIRELTRKIHIG